MKRSTAILAAAFAATSLLAACSSGGPESAGGSAAPDAGGLKGDITFLTHRTDLADTVLTDIAEEFMAKNPGVKITVESSKGDDVLKTQIAANELPDIMFVPSGLGMTRKDYPTYFVPIDDLGYTKENLWYYENGAGPDNHLYTLSIGLNYQGFVYSKAAFRAAGIEQAPKTMEEFLAAAEKLKAKGITPVASNFKDGWPLGNYADGAYSNDLTGSKNYQNTLISKDLFAKEPGSLLEGIQFLKTLADKGYLEKDLMSTNWDASKRDLAQGKIGMTYLGTWLPAQIEQNGGKPEDIGMFPVPGAKALVGSADYMYGVTKNSKSPEAAKAFLKFMWDNGYMPKKAGMIPPNKDYKADEPFLKELLSYNLPIVEWEAHVPEYQELINKAQIDAKKAAQEYVLAENPQEVIDKYNKKWAEARKALGK
ncbi:ABC transporter substrate-binding protein [Paenibacillus mucilaginosus]|uniref:ABC transporter substrate-binding protein n=1 Tax=Paenibacillus mucilaginosus TaxID=61624 RepID=UPI00059FBC18|nr:extracellular solute-binding protein [Paenibacillus mucilaginosus]MCG7217209.1 extracellular solute-binding protein [Paenibacillus mucilaginosus]WDM29165.1 extracellular solute-binding protein [Paenibacillus mucilaginosus]